MLGWSRAPLAPLAAPPEVALFAYSVAWRAPASTRIRADIGTSAESLRASLLAGARPPSAWCVFRLLGEHDGPLERLITVPVTRNHGTHAVSSFHLVGLGFQVSVGPHVPADRRHFLEHFSLDEAGVIVRTPHERAILGRAGTLAERADAHT